MVSHQSPLLAAWIPAALGAAWLALSPGLSAAPRLDPWPDASADVGEEVVLHGAGFGTAPGTVVLTGRRIAPRLWSDAYVAFSIPDDGASGWLLVRHADGASSETMPFTVSRDLPAGQIAPYGLQMKDTGLPGAAFLVETDGSHLYGVSGFETLSTYRIEESRPHRFCSRIFLNQRIADLRVRDGYLFCVGDHGLIIYRTADLQKGTPTVAAAIAGASFMAVDVRPDPAGEFGGLLLVASEHMPRWGQNILRVPFYQFSEGELIPLSAFSRVVDADERQFGVALDPLHRKAYVSGWITLTGTNKYLLELSTTNLASPTLQHREETGAIMAGDLDAIGDVLWAGLVSTVLGNQLFHVFTLNAGTEHLSLHRVITGRPAAGRVARVKIVDSRVTVGCSWYGNRPDIFLLDTLGTNTTPAATHNSLDWAFDVTGYAHVSGTNAGKLIVADEWGGFITLDHQVTPKLSLSHRPDYQWVVAAAMTEGLHLAGDRVYIAGRGAGPWSANRADLADESQWRHVDFDWTQAEPQPHPVSAVCARNDPESGLLLAALGHDKAMNWGTEIIGLLYRETATNIQLLAQADAFVPPGGILGGTGVGAVWPEPDLVFMATGSDGLRAYVVQPGVPAITLHRQCRASGFATNLFSTAMKARCLRHYADGGGRKLVVGSTPGLLVGDPTLLVFAVSYPSGVPDRGHPDRPISVVHEAALQCLKWKPVSGLDVRPSGLAAVATSAGLGLFHLSWVPELNQTNDLAAWNRIHVSVEAFAPWWPSNWTADIADVSFADDNALYVVKTTEGLWRMSFELDPKNRAYRCMATAYYPGVGCGMDYTRQLHGWANPDIVTLHHPYAVVADGDAAYVTGWSGKVQRLVPAPDAGVRLQQISREAGQVALEFISPFLNRRHQVEAADNLRQPIWLPRPDAIVRQTADHHYHASCALSDAPAQFYRVRVRP